MSQDPHKSIRPRGITLARAKLMGKQLRDQKQPGPADEKTAGQARVVRRFAFGLEQYFQQEL
jgi:hypothetical protein